MAEWGVNLATGQKPEPPKVEVATSLSQLVGVLWQGTTPSDRHGYEKRIDLSVYVPREVTEEALIAVINNGLEWEDEDEEDNG
jgi:hypothetical protein